MTVKAAIEQARAELDFAWELKFPNGEFLVEQCKRNNELQVIHFRKRPTSHNRFVCCWINNTTDKHWSWILKARKWKFSSLDKAIEKALLLGMNLNTINKIHQE